jgi:Ca2+-transporting ATPase
MMKRVSLLKLKGLPRVAEGLSGAEVSAQRARFGSNDLLERAGNPWSELLGETLKDPMIWFLIAIGVVFFLVGERAEAVLLFVATVPLVGMDVFLHWRTQASTSTLRSQMATHSIVVREGRNLRVDSKGIVPGDLVVLSAADSILPADGLLETSDSIQVDESMLTGEALPIRKRAISSAKIENSVEVLLEPGVLGFAGTRVLTGSGQLRNLSTGRETAYGEIVHSVFSLTQERTTLQKSIARLT